jgi:hypothetical protein
MVADLRKLPTNPQWLAETCHDVLFIIYVSNDHVTSFLFDPYSHFVLGNGFRI